jgi:hypothetical protein
MQKICAFKEENVNDDGTSLVIALLVTTLNIA